MSWKTLKTFAIVILLVIDSFFFMEIRGRVRAESHYDPSLIDSAVSVLHESELYVDRKFLAGKIVSLPVYAGESDAGTLADAFLRAGYTGREEPLGTRYVGEDEEFFFGNDFSFFYFTKETEEKPSLLLRDGTYVRVGHDSMAENAERAVYAFLRAHGIASKKRGQYGYVFQTAEVYVSGGTFIVHVMQFLDGLAIADGAYFLVEGDRVMAADGMLSPAAPSSRLKAETLDLMDILFIEKTILDERYRESGEVSRERRVLSSVTYFYEPYFGADGRFYLVPVCTLSYTDGKMSRYNLVSGKPSL